MRPTNRWSILALLLVTTTIGLMGFALPFALLPHWIRELGLSKAQGGLLSGLWYLPGLVVSLPVGWAMDRAPGRPVLAALWVLVAAGMLVMASAQGFVMLCAGRLLFSVGMNGHMVAAPKLLGAWFAGRRELGLVMGLYTIAFTAGVFATMQGLGAVAGRDGAAAAVRLLAGLSVAGLALVAVLPGAPADGARVEAPAGGGPFRPWVLGGGAWVLALAYFGYSIGTDSYLAFAPDSLVDRGVADAAAAASAIGAYALPALLLKPVLSSFLTRARAPWFVAGAVVVALAAYALLFAPLPPRASSALFGVSMALAMPALYALPNYVLPASRAGQGYGLYNLLYSLGFAAQPLVGVTVDRTGWYGAGFAVIALYTAAGALVLLPLVRAAQPREA